MKKRKVNRFEKLSSEATRRVGSTGAFLTAAFLVACWLITGPAFGFSDTWQLFINTGTTIVTFLMVFLIQRSQNKEALAMQIKLNELIASSRDASNRLIDIEDLSEDELRTLEKYFAALVRRAKVQGNIHESHSIEESAGQHERKTRARAKPKQTHA